MCFTQRSPWRVRRRTTALAVPTEQVGLSLVLAGNKEPGVVVTEVDPTARPADFGFRPGDVILDVGGKHRRPLPHDVHKRPG